MAAVFMLWKKQQRWLPFWQTEMLKFQQSLAELLYAGAALDPSAIAIEQGDQTLSYEELLYRVESVAATLLKKYPEPGSRIGLCATNHVDHLVAYLAILLAGIIWIPINPANGRALNAVIAEKVQPNVILVDSESVANAPGSDLLLFLDDLTEENGNFQPSCPDLDDIAAIKFTGGTTGEPKGVLQTHSNMLAVIENMQAFYKFNQSDCNLVIAPLTHGSSHFILPILAVGGRHRFLPDRSAESIIGALGSGVTTTFMPPTLIYKLLDADSLAPGKFNDLRHLTYGAAPMLPGRISEAQRMFGPCISTIYGQTEAPMMITALTAEEMQDVALCGTVGRSCRNTQIRIVNEENGVLPVGTAGSIEVSGPIVMPGYLNNPLSTAATIREGWLRTGDLGYIDASGYLTIVGRASDLIITGGFNVYPTEVENILAEAPGVSECCVFGVEDPYWGERIDAVIVLSSVAVEDKDKIVAFVRERLGAIRTPKNLYVTQAIPRNGVGKVVRRDMPDFIKSLQAL